MTISIKWAVGITAGFLAALFLTGYIYYGRGYREAIAFVNASPGDTSKVTVTVPLFPPKPVIRWLHDTTKVAVIDTAAVDSIIALKKTAVEAAYLLSQSFEAEDIWQTFSKDSSLFLSGKLNVAAFPIDKSFSWRLSFTDATYNRESIFKHSVIVEREFWWIKPAAVVSGIMAAKLLDDKKYAAASVFGGITVALVVIRWNF